MEIKYCTFGARKYEDIDDAILQDFSCHGIITFERKARGIVGKSELCYNGKNKKGLIVKKERDMLIKIGPNKTFVCLDSKTPAEIQEKILNLPDDSKRPTEELDLPKNKRLNVENATNFKRQKSNHNGSNGFILEIVNITDRKRLYALIKQIICIYFETDDSKSSIEFFKELVKHNRILNVVMRETNGILNGIELHENYLEWLSLNEKDSKILQILRSKPDVQCKIGIELEVKTSIRYGNHCFYFPKVTEQYFRTLCNDEDTALKSPSKKLLNCWVVVFFIDRSKTADEENYDIRECRFFKVVELLRKINEGHFLEGEHNSWQVPINSNSIDWKTFQKTVLKAKG
jgi:hypothetical protein